MNEKKMMAGCSALVIMIDDGWDVMHVGRNHANQRGGFHARAERGTRVGVDLVEVEAYGETVAETLVALAAAAGAM